MPSWASSRVRSYSGAMSRAGRAFLALLLLVACAAGAAPADAQVSIMHGPADQSSMTLWVQTAGPGRVRATVWGAADPDGTPPVRQVEGEPRAEDDYVLHLRLA